MRSFVRLSTFVPFITLSEKKRPGDEANMRSIWQSWRLGFSRYGDHKTDYSYISVLERSVSDTALCILPILGFEKCTEATDHHEMG